MPFKRTFFKGDGVHVHVYMDGGQRKARVSGGVAGRMRPKLMAFLKSLPIENATLFITGENGAWTLESVHGLSDDNRQRLLNFLASEM